MAVFPAQPPGYQKAVLHWITSAKKEETRLRRLDQLIEHSAAGALGLLTSNAAR